MILTPVEYLIQSTKTLLGIGLFRYLKSINLNMSTGIEYDYPALPMLCDHLYSLILYVTFVNSEPFHLLSLS